MQEEERARWEPGELRVEEEVGVQQKPVQGAQEEQKEQKEVEEAQECSAQTGRERQTEDATVGGCCQTAAGQACSAYHGKSRARHHCSQRYGNG